jgi:hypothetical protein
LNKPAAKPLSSSTQKPSDTSNKFNFNEKKPVAAVKPQM